MQINSRVEPDGCGFGQGVRSAAQEAENPGFYREWISQNTEKNTKCRGNVTKPEQETGQPKTQEKTDELELIRQRMEEILTRLENGNRKPSFQIGGQSFTEEEWDEFLKSYDQTEEKKDEASDNTENSWDALQEDIAAKNREKLKSMYLQ